MKDLNQNQLVLLVLLVSFVTSIATGIATVSLLQQAPVELTRTISNVVEKTIQQVTPAPTTAAGQKDTTTTVVVKEEDLILNSINKNIRSLVRIYGTDTLGQKSLYGLGVILNKNGVIATEGKGVTDGYLYTATTNDGAEYKIIPYGSGNTNTVFFRINLPEKTPYNFSGVQFASGDLQLGQSVIGLGGDTQNSVAVGRVTTLLTKDQTVGTTTMKVISTVESDASSKDFTIGSPFFNLSGDLVGLKTTDTSSGTFVPISGIYKEFVAISQ